MPRINIREVDNTGNEDFQYLDYTVLIPGVYLEYPAESGEQAKPFEGLLTKITDIPDGLVATGSEFKAEEDLGYEMARTLLKRGLSVYYKGVYTLHQSENTAEVEPEIKLKEDVKELFKDFEDKGKYDIRFISFGWLNKLEGDQLKIAEKAALQCAGNRGDAIALFDAPNSKISSVEIDTYIQEHFKAMCAEEIVREGISWVDGDAEPEHYGRYGFIFAPEIQQGDNKLPLSFNYLCCFAEQIRTTPEWFATAGAVRGVSPLRKIQPTLLFGDNDVNILQPRSYDEVSEENPGHIDTNVICEVRPYGYVVWGNRTMEPLAGELKASNFANIRQIACTIKKVLYRAAKRFTFDPNSDVLWYNFKNAIVPTLEKMKTNQGIRGYQIIKVPTKKKALLVAHIIINPIEAVEDFDCTVELSDQILEVAEN